MYEVTEKKHFPIKYIPPKARGQWLSDVIDVDNATDYKEMVKKISEDKPPVVKIFVDMQHIKKLPQVVKSSDDLECTSDSSKEDGQATITPLPNIKSFNMDNKAPILHPMSKAATQPTPTALDLNSLTLAILLWMLAQFDAGLHSLTAPVTPMPQTPKQPKVKDMDGRSSPPIPSPSKLACYPQFAESHLSVQHAMSYNLALEMHGIGPDILPDDSNKLLADLGLSAALGAPGPSSKCPNTQDSRLLQVSYERWYHGGGSWHFTTLPMHKGNGTWVCPKSKTMTYSTSVRPSNSGYPFLMAIP
ncbi:hypothetical protein EV401DRAFT_1891929 [Pisolithus croceorrhizus]|nr:hypothetical protein EV401DRAFT_1891929 [Pisolithus croceorrhizus]